MTVEIALVLSILVIALVLFVSEWLRMDLVALMVLVSLTVTGLVEFTDAFIGFSNPAVITVWSMFILSEALSRSGIASIISHQLLRMTGSNEFRMVIMVMLTSGSLSAIMNNIGVAALMLPVVMDLCRQTGLSPSRLLMPLAYGTLLGGLTTLFGTPPNLLVSDALKQNGLASFQIFDFAPIGLSALIFGTIFVALIGRHLLPKRDVSRLKQYQYHSQKNLVDLYGLMERISVLRVPRGSSLINKPLFKAQLTNILGLTIIGLFRQGKAILLPSGHFHLNAGDRLLVEGRTDHFNELKSWQELSIERQTPILQKVASEQLVLAEVCLTSKDNLINKRFNHSDFRDDFGVVVLAIRRGLHIFASHLSTIELKSEDWLLVQGNKEQIESLKKSPTFSEVKQIDREKVEELYNLDHLMFIVRVPQDTKIVGQTMSDSRLGDAFDFRIVGLLRESEILLMPDPTITLQEKDLLLIQGCQEDLAVLHGLQELELETEKIPDLNVIESEKMALLEVMLSPRSSLLGKSVDDILFEDKYGLRILAIWRKGRSIRSDLEKQKLDNGDAFLLLGPRDKFELISQDDDFLVLTSVSQVKPSRLQSTIAVLVMLAVIIPVLINWLPISVAAVMGACLMIVSGVLSMEDAYHAIDWRSVFLIAGMIPLGGALENTGAASYLASSLLAQLSGLGPWPVVVALYLLTMLTTLVMPNAALVVVMSPMVFYFSQELSVSPHSLMMVVAIAASASFASPISHPANTLVMGPGGYSFGNYLKMGLPLTFVVMLVSLLLLPIFWPF